MIYDVQDLTYRYPGGLLQKRNLYVGKGRSSTILGPNGGKSTLFNCLANIRVRLLEQFF